MQLEVLLILINADMNKIELSSDSDSSNEV